MVKIERITEELNEKEKPSKKALKKEEDQTQGSSPVCYANSKELRPEYLNDQSSSNKDKIQDYKGRKPI